MSMGFTSLRVNTKIGEDVVAAEASITHTAQPGDASPLALTILDVPTIEHFMVSILRAGIEVKSDAVVTASGAVLTITNSVGYTLAAGDVIYITAKGSR